LLLAAFSKNASGRNQVSADAASVLSTAKNQKKANPVVDGAVKNLPIPRAGIFQNKPHARARQEKFFANVYF